MSRPGRRRNAEAQEDDDQHRQGQRGQREHHFGPEPTPSEWRHVARKAPAAPLHVADQHEAGTQDQPGQDACDEQGTDEALETSA